jgi:hypothetical protein
VRDFRIELSVFTMTLVIVIMLSAAAPVFAARSPKINAPKSFQAQFTLQVGGNPPQHGIMYYSHGRIREEIEPDQGGQKSITIIDPMNKTIYEVEEQKKSFRIQPWDPRSALLSEALKRSGKRRFVETQTIDGQVCENFEITPKERNVRPFFIFVNKSTRFPVRLTTQDPDPSKQIHIEWTNLSPGYQAAILFTPPMGYAELK